jgi:amidase
VTNDQADWGCDYFSDSSLSGPTLNPYSLDRDSGGSSSGLAAGLAADLALAGVGSDSGGSIRIPASFCHIVGLRPTNGLMSGRGCMNGILRQGGPALMGRRVEDVARMMDVTAVFDGDNHLSGVHFLRQGRGGYAEQLGKCDLSTTRIGVIRAFFGDEDVPEQAAVNKTINDLLGKLASQGATIVDVEIPDLQQHLGASNMFLTRFRSDESKVLRNKFDTSLEDIVARGQYPAAVNAGLPWLVEHGLEDHYGGDGTYGRQVDATALFTDAVLCQMVKHGVSALVFPTMGQPAPLRDGLDIPARLKFPHSISFASQLRWPAMCLPAGFEGVSDMPVGLEVVMPPLRDAELLSLGYAIEKVAGERRAPKL